MRSGSWFGEISKSLQHGLFADKVILALAKAQRDRDGVIPQNDQELFRRAADFLKDAISGYEWIENPSFNSASAKHASLFGQVVRAFSVASAPEDFINQLRKLESTAESLADGEKPGNDEVTILREFFVSHSAAEMERADELFETPKFGSREVVGFGKS
ncbi:MAG: hypothetical protein ABSF71_31090 [Terriglobia bacterium]|jgi:hypothetical protein